MKPTETIVQDFHKMLQSHRYYRQLLYFCVSATNTKLIFLHAFSYTESFLCVCVCVLQNQVNFCKLVTKSESIFMRLLTTKTKSVFMRVTCTKNRVSFYSVVKPSRFLQSAHHKRHNFETNGKYIGNLQYDRNDLTDLSECINSHVLITFTFYWWSKLFF